MATLRSEVLGPHSPSGRTAWSRRAELFTALARIHGDADRWTLFTDVVGGRPRDTLLKIRQVTGWDRTPDFAHSLITACAERDVLGDGAALLRE